MLILISVSLEIAYCSWISVDVFFVTSRDSIKALFSRIVAGSASDKFYKRADSRPAKVTKYWFYLLTSYSFVCSRSGFSTLTTIAKS